MTNLVLTRKAGQAVRLIIERVRFRDSLRIAEGISVCVVDLAKGHAKLNFTAPREVQILRTELIKEDV